MNSHLALVQEATFWLRGDNDGKGTYSFSGPEVMPARVMLGEYKVTDELGRRLSAQLIVYCKTDIPIGTYVAIGNHGEAIEPPIEAYEVAVARNNPSMSDLFVYYLTRK